LPITREEVLKIADLSNLHFNEDEIDAFTAQFQRILDYIAKLSEVDTAGAESTSHVSLVQDFEKHVLRPDEVRSSLPVESALTNAPDAGHDHFKVPKVL
jgi:aspartyl-tRNA(Asn)/glutamyl-tRNA(Gln) amidotransferase subunit C